MARYYYASGERVPIEADEARVAIDPDAAGEGEVEALLGSGSKAPRLPGGVVVVERAAVGEAGLRRLEKRGALRPVYRRGGATMVPLPEVRVEFDDEAQRRAVLGAVPRSPHPVQIQEDRPERLVLRCTSGSGDDALDVANFLFETAHPAASSVRFVQFVPRPEPSR